MAEFGVHLNYKKEIRYNWIHCTVAGVIPTVLCALTYLMYGVSSSFVWIAFMPYHFPQSFVIFGTPLTYIFLLRSLNERFAELNSLLRYNVFDYD